MKLARRKVVRFIVILTVTVQLAGCVSSEKFYEDALSSRQAAYQQWKSRKQRQERSQTHISGELSLEDCLKLTLANNKTLRRIVQEKDIARGGELKSYSAILPTVGLSADYLRKDEVASFDVGGRTVSFGDLDNYSAAVIVTQPIFAGGSIPAKINAARLTRLLADQTVQAAVEQVIFDATHGYYDVLLNQHLYQISADAVRFSQAQLDDVRKKREGGVASDFDVLRAQVELSNFQAELIKNKNAINLAEAGLLKIMGISQDSDFELSNKLVYVSSELTFEQAVQAAFRNRPDLLGRELDINRQKQLLKVSRSQYWPTVSAFYDNSWSKPDPHRSMEIEWGHAWQAGVSAVLPVFDGLAREGEIIQQKARLRQAQINLVDAEETALFELTSAQLSIENAREFVESQRLNLTRAEEGLRLAQVGYQQGTNTQLETIDAQAALTTARANYYQAIYAHVVAKLALQRAMGSLATYKPLAPEKNPEMFASLKSIQEQTR
jgi:outer membrane protein TolC